MSQFRRGLGELRFLVSRRWIGFGIFVIALAGVCVQLGAWQFDKLDEREDRNALVAEHLAIDPVELNSVVPAGQRLDPEQEWTVVTATGRYDLDRQVTVKYVSRDGRPGVDVLTPFVLDDGTALLVNRGFVETLRSSTAPTDLPVPTSATVEVTGWLRPNSGATGEAVRVSDTQVRAISSDHRNWAVFALANPSDEQIDRILANLRLGGEFGRNVDCCVGDTEQSVMTGQRHYKDMADASSRKSQSEGLVEKRAHEDIGMQVALHHHVCSALMHQSDHTGRRLSIVGYSDNRVLRNRPAQICGDCADGIRVADQERCNQTGTFGIAQRFQHHCLSGIGNRNADRACLARRRGQGFKRFEVIFHCSCLPSHRLAGHELVDMASDHCFLISLTNLDRNTH